MKTLPDSNSVVMDIYTTVSDLSQDISPVAVTGTMEVSVSNMPKDNQPNGWVQLLLPIFITLFVVFIDKWVTRWYAHRDEKDARKQFRDTVLDWIMKIEPIERSFCQSVQQLSDSIQASDDMQPVAFAMPLTLHDMMKEMSVEKMTEAFLKDFKDNKDKRYANMYNIISNFEFLSKISDSVRESYDSYNKQSFALCQQWNGLFEKFREKCHKMKDGNPYEATLTVWFAQLLQTPNSVKTHIQALDALCLLSFKENDFEMLSMVSKMRDIARQSQATSEGYAKVFTDIAGNIDLTLNSLSASEKFFRSEVSE